MSRTLERYLDRHARPEHAVASRLPTYDAAIVVPVRNEDAAFVEGMRAACVDARVLLVIVVNGRIGDRADVHEANVACLQELSARGAGRDLADGIRWIEADPADLLLVDRASSGRRFGPDDGVGLARRIGSDVVASMWASGRLRQGWIHNTDADAVLARGHVTGCEAAGDAVALVHPYWHVPSGDPSIDRAVALYEIGLRWYVVGLAAAGSRWSYATLGSCISVRIDAYAAVRGTPLRQAAEDFYLLAKVAKLGPVIRLEHAPVRLESRPSDRVPFGTGPGVRRLMALEAEGRTPCVYHPETFDLLKQTLDRLRAFAHVPDHPVESASEGLDRAWRALDLEQGLRGAIRSASGERQRLRAVLEWFGAFRTLELVHALRDGGLHPMPWPEAIGSFSATSDLADAAARGELDLVRATLAAREPARSGNPDPFNSGSRTCTRRTAARPGRYE
jgi:hypothetical protein